MVDETQIMYYNMNQYFPVISNHEVYDCNLCKTQVIQTYYLQKQKLLASSSHITAHLFQEYTKLC